MLDLRQKDLLINQQQKRGSTKLVKGLVFLELKQIAKK